MNQRIDFTQLDGLGLCQDGLEFMQSSYRNAIAAIASSMGNFIIVKGVDLVAGNYTNGWVVVNGELLPFVGGLAAPYMYVEATNGTELFGDLSNRPVYETKSAKLTSLVGGFPIANFKRYKSDAINLNDSDVVASAKAVKGVVDYLLPLCMPVGGIIMWAGLIVNIPAGWALCDGTGGTPNLSGRFVVGYDAADADYDYSGIRSGGTKRHTLTVDEMPSHNHAMKTGDGSGSKGAFNDNDSGFMGAVTGATGGGQPHENRPPYFTLAYIQKLP